MGTLRPWRPFFSENFAKNKKCLAKRGGILYNKNEKGAAVF